jgi:hypothetical protein
MMQPKEHDWKRGARLNQICVLRDLLLTAMTQVHSRNEVPPIPLS